MKVKEGHILGFVLGLGVVSALRVNGGIGGKPMFNLKPIFRRRKFALGAIYKVLDLGRSGVTEVDEQQTLNEFISEFTFLQNPKYEIVSYDSQWVLELFFQSTKSITIVADNKRIVDSILKRFVEAYYDPIDYGMYGIGDRDPYESIGKLTDTGKQKFGHAHNKHWLSRAMFTRRSEFFGRRDLNFLKPFVADAEKGVEIFNLHGIEFGNWLNEADRTNHYLGAMAGFKDLADVMNVRQSEIGLDGTLHLALGSRGIARSKAHYQFSKTRPHINMNKRNGANSLAHEYGHAMDFHLGKLYPKVTNIPSGGRSVRKDVDQYFYDLGEKGNPSYYFEKLFEVLYWNGNRPTNFQLAMKSQNKYWASRVEIWARTYEAYVAMKLADKGIKNNYLAKSSYVHQVYPSKALIKKSEHWIRKIIRLTYK